MRSVGMTLEFENPPINELVIGIFFNPMDALRAEHVGAFWATVREAFPNSSQNPALIRPGTAPVAQFPLPKEVFPLPRFWFISGDESNLIQLQRDAFFFNWRRGAADYPRFKNVFAQFQKYFSLFADFAGERLNVSTIVPIAFELTYINMIGSAESVFSPSDYSKVVPEVRLPAVTLTRRAATDFNHFDLYQIAGNLQLNVAHRSVRRVPGGEFAVLMEIKVTGQSGENIDEWFSRAHDIVLETFEFSTDPSIQNSIWRKKSSQKL